MMYALNLAEDGRYLSSCDPEIWCPPGTPVVDSLPTGETEAEQEPHNWRYVDGVWIFDPKPEQPEPEPPEPDIELTVWDELDAAYQEGVNSV